MRSIAYEYSSGSTQENLEVEPRRPSLGISEIQADHVIKLDPASTTHLPETGNARLHFQDSLPVPCLVGCYFVRNRRTRSDQRHFSPEHIQELRKFIQATPPQERSYRRDSSVVRKLVDANPVAVALAWIALGLAGDQLGHIFPVNAGIIADIHRPEFKEREGLTVLSDPPLPE